MTTGAVGQGCPISFPPNSFFRGPQALWARRS